MARSHKITINDKTFWGRRGDLLLDAALSNGVEIPYDCRGGTCGTCCVRLTEGRVHGGEGSSPGVIHACQARIVADATIESETTTIRQVEGTVCSLRPLSNEVVEVGIRTHRALPYLAGQYAQVRFRGFPSRAYSLSHPLQGGHERGTIWLHVRRVDGGRVSTALGRQIAVGHPVTLTGPYGSAHFRPNLPNRLILVSTGTGFSPIWAIVAAALNENPHRKILVIAGGRGLETLYMGPVLSRLARFPNVLVIPCCSKPQTVTKAVKLGRPTDFIPRLHASDVIYCCGVPAMVNSIREMAARFGAACYADPFLPSPDQAEDNVLTRALSWLPLPTVSARHRIAIASRQKHLLTFGGARTPARAVG